MTRRRAARAAGAVAETRVRAPRTRGARLRVAVAWRLAVAFAAAAGCGGPTRPAAPGATARPPVAADAAGGAPLAPAAVDAAPTADAGATAANGPRARCEQLVDHLAAVAVADAPADRRDAARDALAHRRDDLVAACEVAPPDAAAFACAMAASTAAAVDACVRPPDAGSPSP